MGDDLLSPVKQAISGGIHLLQYRNKNALPQTQLIEAVALAALCRAHNVSFIINDNPQLAAEVGAEGVHLGQSDSNITHARQILGADKIIGITCHASLTQAQTAEQAGADYVAFGRFFPSQTKPDAPPAEINILQQARDHLSIPIVAIGGITPENGDQLIEAGADMLAVIHGIFGVTEIKQATQRYVKLFART
ncbi:Thiamin-phosphate pyrophosphorylase [hydrothermal vent metagenome]|uniref:thiamine phosphate synthase n=1 Tax=hydrothermal vent metagenome TaxID=652676 RepID=A0A3B1BE41_9ZZZZ